MDREKKVLYVMQPYLIKNLEDTFQEEVNNLSVYGTLGTQRFKIVKSNEDIERIELEKQSRYRSGVGMLLHLIKYSRPDIANVVRELLKCIDGANLAAYKEMLRTIKFVLNTKDYCLKMNHIYEYEEWDLVYYSDSDWAGDPETRISITGFVIYLLRAPICWRSRGLKGVTLSSSEAEYVAMLETVKEIRFVYYLLKGMGVDVKLLIIFRSDNAGAIFMVENSSSGVHTHHIDTRNHFIREHVEYLIIRIVFVKSEEKRCGYFYEECQKRSL